MLVRTAACGICGSDLHALSDFERFVELSRRAGAPGSTAPRGSDAQGAKSTEVDNGTGEGPESCMVFGHEFCAEVLEHGPSTERTIAEGRFVCSFPVVFGPVGPEPIGYSNLYPGGLGELMILQEMLMLPVPEGVTGAQASLTEPMAVGEHAAAIGSPEPGDVCLVIGCGPVGLAVVSALRARGLGPILAADFSPARRRLAELLGADEVFDPAETSPHARWADLGVPVTIAERAAFGMLGQKTKKAIVFEAVGLPGVLQTIIDAAPPATRVVVVGVCMKPDTIEPFIAVTKELELLFSFAYSPDEFAATLRRIGEGEIPCDELITSRVSLDDVSKAFEELANPNQQGKIVVIPGSEQVA